MALNQPKQITGNALSDLWPQDKLRQRTLDAVR